ncbi:hypothetical protein ACFC4S_22410 [Priestia megaterium]|uniref:hypothetical protein n=1 Tax=Priestia megaterium TaxID=1404 RepID=UPI0035DE910B
MLGITGAIYRLFWFIFATFFCAIPTINALIKAVYGQHKEHYISAGVGAVMAAGAHFMFFRSLKRVRQYKQRHNIDSEDTEFVKQEEVSYSEPSNQKNFDPKGGAF